MKFKINENSTKIVLRESTREEFNQLKLYLNRYVKDYRFMPRYKMGIWDGKVDFFNNGIIDIGLWYEIIKCCKEYGYQFNIENKENFPRKSELNREDRIPGIGFPNIVDYAKSKNYRVDFGDQIYPNPKKIVISR